MAIPAWNGCSVNIGVVNSATLERVLGSRYRSPVEVPLAVLRYLEEVLFMAWERGERSLPRLLDFTYNYMAPGMRWVQRQIEDPQSIINEVNGYYQSGDTPHSVGIENNPTAAEYMEGMNKLIQNLESLHELCQTQDMREYIAKGINYLDGLPVGRSA